MFGLSGIGAVLRILGSMNPFHHSCQRREMMLRLQSYQSSMHLPVERIKPLIAHWTFDRANEGILIDASGNGNDGQLTGAAKLIPDHIGSALSLNGDGGYVECSNESAFDLRDEMAVSCWIRVKAFTPFARRRFCGVCGGGGAFRW